MKAEDITALYTDYEGDFGDRYEYRWLARWTTKSLIITADQTCDMPLCRKSSRFIVPRKRAEADLTNDGHVHHNRECYNVRPWAVREAEHVARLEQEKEAEARREMMYDALPDARKELIDLYAKWKELYPSTADKLTLSEWIDRDGGDEVVRARITGKKYRSIDAL